jgi:hypothetical protein
MENIEKIKKQYIHFFSKKYYSKKLTELSESEMENCSLLAELWAYVYKTVPEDHGKYSIFDFDGNVLGKSGKTTTDTLPVHVAQNAKDKICEFCWGMRWKDIAKEKEKIGQVQINAFLRKKSIMMDRCLSGNNIAIFGSSDRPIGRTMLASIVMKEAIRLRVTHGDRGQSYDWIDFSKLFHAIEKDAEDLVDYKSCDWLVVDNIVKKARSARQNTLMVDMMDPFFINRYNNKQPTILAFKFDIRDKDLDMEKTFGLGISKILNSKRTLKIPLSEYILREVDD